MTKDAWPDDETEFERVYLTHHPGVYRLVFRIAGSHPEAEDLVQETFLRLHRQCFGGETDSSPSQPPLSAWLYRVAINLALNARRSENRRSRREQSAAWPGVSMGDSADDPAETVARREERDQVHQILKSLPPRHAEILFLRYAGLSYREVAEAIGVAPSSVGTLLARAEAAFCAALRPPARGENHHARVRDRV